VETATATAHAERLRPRFRPASIAGSRVLWLAIGLTIAGTAIRFSTLGLQSYHHDEVITAARVLPGSFGHMLHEVHRSESTPWLYYVLAWVWSKSFGLGAVGLRSLSALCGAAAIPVAYLIGRELAGRRAGLMTMALVAFNPMLIWYSQEARAYSLMILLCAFSLLFFLRFRRTGASADLMLWSASSALALTSHYFAAFPLAIETAWLLVETRPRRRLVAPIAGIAAACLLIAPLELHQASNLSHINWIGNSSLLDRLEDSAYSVFIGETGKVIGAAGPREGYAAIPAALAAAIFGLALFRGRNGERRATSVGLIVGFGAVALAVAAALLGKDYILARNLLPALLPLLAATGVAAACIRDRRLATILVGALCAYWIAFNVHVDTTQGLQRPDWSGIAESLGPAKRPRAIVTWTLGIAPLQLYLHDGTEERLGAGKGPLRVPEVDLITKRGDVHAPDLLESRFPKRDVIPLGRFTIIRYRAPHAVTLGLRLLRHLPTGFDSNSVMVGGAKAFTVGPLPHRQLIPELSKSPQLVAKEVERHRQRHRDRLGLQVGQLGRHKQLQGNQVDHQRRKADGKESRRLKAGRSRSGAKGPDAVPGVVAGHRHAEGAHGGH
jgi:mannosyltransferase